MPVRYGLNRTLGAGIAFLGLTTLVSSSVVLWEVGKTRDAVAAEDRSRAVIADLDLYRAGMLNEETAVRGFLITQDRVSLQPYEKGAEQVRSANEDLQHWLQADSERMNLLAAARAAAESWRRQVADKIVNEGASEADRNAALGIETSGTGRALFDAFRAALKPIETHERESLVRQVAEAARAQRDLSTVMTIAASVILLTCLAVGFALSRRVAVPLEQLAEVMRRLVRRDVSVEVPHVRRRDEVGEMARAVQIFRANLIELDRTTLLRVTIDTLPAMVVYVTGERRIAFYNSEFARAFLTDGADAHGRTIDEALPPPGLPGGKDRLEEALRGEEIRFEHGFIRGDGSRGELEAHFRPHHGPGGHILGVVALLTDVSVRKDLDRRLLRQARELQRSNEELEQFAYVASHDLKAPLRGIENLVSWIEEDLIELLQDETRTNMDLLKKRVKRLESLLDDLLAYSRAGRDSLEAQEVNVRELVEDLAALVSPPEGLQVIVTPSLPILVTPKAPLAQVFQNLIGNAIKHHDAPSQGRILVEAEEKGPMIVFRVTDNGPGVPEQFRNRVFGMFQTLRPRDDVEGSGMGLAIVRKLVERQGGSVWLTDSPEGRGLSVNFTWPAIFKEAQDGASRESVAR